MTSRKRETGTGDPISTIMSSLLTVHTAQSLEWLVDAAATAAERALGASFTYVFFEDSEGRLEHKAPASDVRRRSQQVLNDAAGQELFRRKLDPSDLPGLAEALDATEPVHITTAELLAPIAGAKAAAAAQRAPGAEHACIVAMETAGERIGALLALSHAEINVEHARLLGEHVAVAAANLRQTNAAREQGEIDIVRSVFDARKLESELQRELARAERYHREVSIIVIEATNLRLLREQFGRFLTERLLQRLGEVLAAHARDIDIIGAYKESGYSMVATEAGSESAVRVAERLLAAAAAVQLEGEDVPGLELHLVAGWSTSPSDGQTTEAMFAAVERRMYGAESTQVA
ncbi:MAG TPA: diguanylate cyclase [Dehalococcoidia bacterium]